MLLFLGDPQRVSGKVVGTINGQYIDSVDLHAYIVSNDGRSFTAISRFPPSLLPSMQSLYAVGDVLGWSFALPLSPKAKNGYAMTGIDGQTSTDSSKNRLIFYANISISLNK